MNWAKPSGCLMVMLAACTEPSDRQANASGVAPPGEAKAVQSAPSQRMVSLESELAAAYSELGTELELSSNPMLAAAISRGRDGWNRRVGECRDETCRVALLADQLNRVQYALGRNGRPVQGLPWSVGHLSIDRGDAGGALRILPIIDNWLIVYGDTAEDSEARWMCDLQAEGQVGPNGVGEIVTLGEIRQRYRLEPQASRRLTITYLSDDIDRACGMNGTLEGDYRVSEVSPEAVERRR